MGKMTLIQRLPGTPNTIAEANAARQKIKEDAARELTAQPVAQPTPSIVKQAPPTVTQYSTAYPKAQEMGTQRPYDPSQTDSQSHLRTTGIRGVMERDEQGRVPVQVSQQSIDAERTARMRTTPNQGGRIVVGKLGDQGSQEMTYAGSAYKAPQVAPTVTEGSNRAEWRQPFQTPVRPAPPPTPVPTIEAGQMFAQRNTQPSSQLFNPISPVTTAPFQVAPSAPSSVPNRVMGAPMGPELPDQFKTPVTPAPLAGGAVRLAAQQAIDEIPPVIPAPRAPVASTPKPVVGGRSLFERVSDATPVAIKSMLKPGRPNRFTPSQAAGFSSRGSGVPRGNDNFDNVFGRISQLKTRSVQPY